MASYQGTYATIKQEVIDQLKLDATLDAARVGRWVNLAYADAVQQTGCLQQAATATLTSGEDSYTIPDEVEWIKLLVIGYADGTVSLPLREVTLEEMLRQRTVTRATGQQIPQPMYAIVGQNQLEVWPEPSSGAALQFWYVYLPTALSADADEPVIHEPFGTELLVAGACVRGARFKKDPLLPDFEADWVRSMGQFQVWLNRREGAAPRAFRVTGGRGGVVASNPSTDVG